MRFAVPFKPLTLLQYELWSPLPVAPSCGLHLKIAKMKWRSLFHSLVAHTPLCLWQEEVLICPFTNSSQLALNIYDNKILQRQSLLKTEANNETWPSGGSGYNSTFSILSQMRTQRLIWKKTRGISSSLYCATNVALCRDCCQKQVETSG